MFLGLSRRARPKPLPLDLTAVSNVNNNLTSLNNNALNNANNAMNNLVAAASPLFQNSPALLNIYAATLSANFMQSQASPLSTFTAAALASPLHFAAAMAASPTCKCDCNFWPNLI
jgi:type VI protein secretion system component VasF